jgi:hypothetical protein
LIFKSGAKVLFHENRNWMFFDSENFQETRTRDSLISKNFQKNWNQRLLTNQKNLTTLVHCFDGQLWWFGFIIKSITLY